MTDRIPWSDESPFVVYTERAVFDENDKQSESIRMISVRLATNFEKGVYYDNRN